jgi:hypothetical protein
VTNHVPAHLASHCEGCGLPLFLYPSLADRTICRDCEGRMELGEPCPRCGRRHAFRFSCGWCGMPVCDGCVYADHEDDDCRFPEEWG